MQLDLPPVLDKSKWHRWFAWRPVIIRIAVPPQNNGRLIATRKLVWLEHVARRADASHHEWEWDYAPLHLTKEN